MFTRGDYEDAYRLSNDDDVFTCRIIIEDSTFNGSPNPRAFNDWFANLDYFFDRYRFFEERRVRFARRKLVCLVRIY